MFLFSNSFNIFDTFFQIKSGIKKKREKEKQKHFIL